MTEEGTSLRSHLLRHCERSEAISLFTFAIRLSSFTGCRTVALRLQIASSPALTSVQNNGGNQGLVHCVALLAMTEEGTSLRSHLLRHCERSEAISLFTDCPASNSVQALRRCLPLYGRLPICCRARLSRRPNNETLAECYHFFVQLRAACPTVYPP